MRTRGEYEGHILDITDADPPFAIVVAKFNSLVTKELLNGAQKALEDFDVSSVDVRSNTHPYSSYLIFINNVQRCFGFLEVLSYHQ